MTFNLDEIVDSVVVGEKTEIDIWNKLKHYLSEYWDGEKHIFDQVLNLSGEKLGQHYYSIQNTASYFEILENNISDRNDMLEFLINLTDYLNYFTENGSVNVAEKLKELRINIKKLRRICLERGIFRDKFFVGREREMSKMRQEIKTGRKKGILVCGLGGMGKTSLTRTVCYNLREDRWKTIKIELREQRTFLHFLRTSILSTKDLQGLAKEMNTALKTEDSGETNEVLTEENRLQHIFFGFFKNRVYKQQRKLILIFDNIDDIEDSAEKTKMLSFFKTILETLTDSTNTRIIVTCREDVLAVPGDKLSELMIKIEVKQLLYEDAEALVQGCTKQIDVEENDVKRIVTECGACPIAIRVICDFINDCRCDKPSELTKRLEPLLSSALNIAEAEWLIQPFIRLASDEKQVICMLSLLGTAKFDLKFADCIINGKRSKCLKHKKLPERRRNSSLQSSRSFDETLCNCVNCDKVRKRTVNLKFKLLSLKRRHLLEIDNDVFDQKEEETSTESILPGGCTFIYSFHPLVSKFLNGNHAEIEESRIKIAKRNFLSFVDEIVMEIGADYDSNVLIAREKAEKLSCYIRKYISFISEIGKGDTIYGKEIIDKLSRTSSGDETKWRNNVIQMVLNPKHHLQFIKAMCNKRYNCSLPKLSWEVEYVAACIRYDEPDDSDGTAFRDLEEAFHSMDTLELSSTEVIHCNVLRARLKYYKGLKLMDSSSDSRKTFELAKQMFCSDQLKHLSRCRVYLADIYNCIGCLEYREHNPDNAIKYHELAVKTLSKQFKYNENLLTYHANIAACHFKKGIQYFHDKQSEKVKSEMEEALKSYNECIYEAKYLKLESTFLYVRKLKNRGDVQTMLHKFDEAQEDYNESLQALRRLCQVPTRTEILVLHAQGEMIRKRIPLCKTKDLVDDLYDLLDKGIETYEKIKEIMDPAIFSGDHEAFVTIRKNHLYFLGQRHETEKKIETDRFYAGYHDQTQLSYSNSSSSSGRSSVNSDTEGNEMSEDEENDGSQGDETNYFKTPPPQNIMSALNGIDPIVDRKSSSGVSSMGSSFSDRDSRSWNRRDSIMSGHGSSFEDEVFDRRHSVDDRTEKRTDSCWSKRRSTLTSFGSSSIERSREDDVDIHGKRKADEVGQSNVKKQKSLDWCLTEKLSSQLGNEREEKGTQTDLTQIDHLLKKEPRTELLMNELTTGNAKLVDDRLGRPIIQYQDEEYQGKNEVSQ